MKATASPGPVGHDEPNLALFKQITGKLTK
jgi:hypothetical protein